MKKDQEYDYFYEEGDEKYCYKNSNILINKLNIKDAILLQKAERDLTEQRYYALLKEGVTGDFTLKHLQSIHQYLFQDIYSWAGELRTVNIAKGNVFCMVPYIETQFNELYRVMSSKHFYKEIEDKNIMAKELSYCISELNVIHPFREGNGRSQRMYCEQLCQSNGRFSLDFSLVSKEEMIEASIKSFTCDYEMMEKIMNKCLIINNQ